MRILFVGTKILPDNMEFHIIQNLQEMGHDVFTFDIKTLINNNQRLDRYAGYFMRILLREPERIKEQALANYVAKLQPDLVIVLLGNMVSPKTISLLKKFIKIPVICWCQDALSNIGRQYMIGAPYDLVFVKDHYMVELFNNMLGNRFRYLPEACNPNVHFYETPPESEATRYQCDVTTAASLYYYRQEILKPVHSRFKLKIWGDIPDWLNYELGDSHTREYIFFQRKRFAFSSASIVLNTLHYAEIDGLNCRFFEIPGCGGFQLVSDKTEVSNFFKLGKEVETFSNRNELIEKIDFYLKEPDLRDAIAKSGLKKAHEEHTYKHRLHELLNQSLRT